MGAKEYYTTFVADGKALAVGHVRYSYVLVLALRTAVNTKKHGSMDACKMKWIAEARDACTVKYRPQSTLPKVP